MYVPFRAGIRRRRAGQELGIALGPSFRAEPLRPSRHIGAFRLEYPTWRYCKKDGTRDLRYSHNRPVYPRSALEFGSWRVSSKDVFELYELVQSLRRRGEPIAETYEERWKRQELAAASHAHHAITSIDQIINRYADTPTGFEEFCAGLFRAMGYRAEVTPPANDGGLDLRMERDGRRYIAECKCFTPGNAVGRPVLQKLYGANATERAYGMLVITTSTFSKGAEEYAALTGIRLLDGQRLMDLCFRVGYATHERPAPLPAIVTLSPQDILANMPPDMRGQV
ncbi:restriction endonuclease [Actinomyces sp. Chiba101]|uniref:restriction endonuclease n=1 Tax=Actinomyces TaxID=1654 RepID=UPI000974F4C0|nr:MULTISPECIES: restriction endonuclease [Actinomyces]BAW92814.1 restriction endonuclease [Actinomyces sp. Chiba101]GAV94214.1 restriction endonuclease [Actinomyces denticolens]SUU06908.1 EcoKMrr [Actinomyces denticolens]